jgi:hypothetical protein
VHGILNYVEGKTAAEAAQILAYRWQPDLAAGYRAAGLPGPVPVIAAPYFADLLRMDAQGASDDITALPAEIRPLAWSWMVALGVPQHEVAQGTAAKPLRQGLDWLARRRGTAAGALARIMTAVLPEVYRYQTRMAVREQARARVIEVIERHRPRVVVAHSLGSVVAWEALHTRPDLPIDLFVTLGSPLGLPELFESLQPAPVDRRGARPAGVGRWVNIADPGDLVAVPRELGGHFDVDQHAEAQIHVADFHRMKNYLACGLTAAAIQPYA